MERLLPDQVEIDSLIDKLYRQEAGKLIAVLTRFFGAEHIELSEDVVQDALTEALSNWKVNGVPENPSGWLYTVAKNKALNVIRKEKNRKAGTSDIAHFLDSIWTTQPALDYFFSEREIQDDQLRMIFMCCHPAISADSQIALALKTLCGFSIKEIASAFVTCPENIHKRLVRARKTIRDHQIQFEVPVGNELEKRLKAVQETIYLLFNEGYNASGGDMLIRNHFSDEAIRLTSIAVSHVAIKSKETTHALLALMLFNSARFAARTDEYGNIITLEHQNRLLWDRARIREGFIHLQKSHPHQFVSKYHILAIISSYHCAASSFESTNWIGILHEYDRLLEIDDTSIVRLNRAVVVAKVEGAGQALAQLEEIDDLNDYHLYHSVKADLQTQLMQYLAAIDSLQCAYKLAIIPAEKVLIKKRMANCKKKIQN